MLSCTDKRNINNKKSIDRNCFCGFMEIEKIYLKMKSLQGRYQGICDAGWIFNSV